MCCRAPRLPPCPTRCSVRASWSVLKEVSLVRRWSWYSHQGVPTFVMINNVPWNSYTEIRLTTDPTICPDPTYDAPASLTCTPIEVFNYILTARNVHRFLLHVHLLSVREDEPRRIGCHHPVRREIHHSKQVGSTESAA